MLTDEWKDIRRQKSQKEFVLNDSLSVVLPVYNAQATLSRQVHDLLDELPELAGDFEILIVDDGSSDNTEDVAIQLSRQYPQVRSINLLKHMGKGVAVRSGIQRSQFDVIFVLDTPGCGSSDLHRLWQLRDDPHVVMARAENRRPLNSGSIHRVMEWGTQLQHNDDSPAAGGIQMIRRQAVLHLSDVISPDTHIQVKTVSRSDDGRFGTDAPNILRRLEQLTQRQAKTH